MNPNKKPNPLFVLIERAAHLIFLNLIFVLCCIPIVTVGSAFTALYAACRAAYKAEPCYRLFFQAFAASFKRATLAWLLLLPFIFFFVFDIGLVQTSLPGLILSGVLLLLCLTIASTVFLYYACFEGTLWELFKSAGILIFTHPVQCLLLTVLAWAPLIVLLIAPMWFLKLFSLWLFVTFSVAAVVGLLLMSKPFKVMAGTEE